MNRDLSADVLKSLAFAVVIVIFLFAFSIGVTRLVYGHFVGIRPGSTGAIASVFLASWYVVFIMLRRDRRMTR